MADRGRVVTLVVVDRAGGLRGATGPIDIHEPWWPEAAPVVDAFPGAIVLRLLDAEPDPGEPMGGQVTYLVQFDGPCPLRPWSGSLTSHPLRQPWAEAGGPEADLDWVASVVEVTGPPRQLRTWNLSSIWSIPTADGAVWLKCVPPFMAHEAAVLDVLADQPVPQLIATDGHRSLMAALPGVDGFEADDDEQVQMVSALVDIQLAAHHRVDDLLRRGVPDLRAEPLVHELSDLVDRLAPHSSPLTELIAQLPDRLAEAAACGPPDTLVHGDPHPGNCRAGADPPVWFDWGDSFIGNPLLDLAVTHRMGTAAVSHWLERWSVLDPDIDPRRAWRLLEPVATLRQAHVFQVFLDNIEPSERVYHRNDVLDFLGRLDPALRR